MKKHSFSSLAASIIAAASVSLSGWAIAQQQAPSGGAAAQGSSQGSPSASGQNGASGQNSSGRAQGASSAQGTGNVERASSAQGSGREGTAPSSQADRSRQDRSDGDASEGREATTARDGATERDTTDRSANDTTKRGTTRIDSRRGGDDQDSSTDRTSRDLRTGRDTSDDSEDRTDRSDRSTDRDEADRDRSGGEGRNRDRDDDQDDRTERDGDVDFGARFTTDSSNRLVVRDLQSRGIFGRAGLRDNDVIISVNGQRVSSWPVMHRLLIAADSRVPLVIWRDGVQQTVYIEEIGVQTRNRTDYGYDDELYQTDRAWLGVFLDTRYENAVVVQAVQEGSAADQAGIRAGDRIMSINGRRVQTPSQLTQIIGSMEPGDQVEIDVARWQTRQVDAELGERPATSRFRYLEEGDTNSAQPNVTIERDDSRDTDDTREALRVQE